ncbi:AAA family ATPase [Burkholderiaceae bacterium UC74_6]
MYAHYFGLAREPFSIAPDPHYLFMSERHREALAHLLYGVRGGGGFVLLTGEIGAGKTTVCRCFLEQIPEGCNVAYIFNPKLSVTELLQTVCQEFHIDAAAELSVKQYVDLINAHLLASHAKGQTNVLIIDEAQNLAADVLEQLRLLTNLETHERKLLQIVLIGQPELRQMLARAELEQLAQRVIARFHLEALSAAETVSYVQHRLNVAGLTGPMPFSAAVLKDIHRRTRGVPRRINLLCDRALLGAYAEGRKEVALSTVAKAADEVFGGGGSKTQRRVLLAGMAAVVLAVAGALMVGAMGVKPKAAAVAAATAASAPASGAASAVAQAAPEDDGKARLIDEPQALSELAALWKVQGQDCNALAAAGLQCLRSEAGLASLRYLDRPAALKLGQGWVLLEGISGQTAQLRAGAHKRSVSLTQLAQGWQGEFVTLWRAPPEYQGKLQAGPSLDWLAERLAKIDGVPAPASAPTSANDFKARVAAFQRGQGLPADGIAGPVTLMQLARATGAADEPRLLK